MLTLLLLVIATALVFEFINGFHDTANSIATVVATKVLTPTQAVMMAAVMNLIGAFWGTAVAKTIASGLVDTEVVIVTSQVLICALSGGIVWNLITWWLGLPSSSSHALIGGLCGAAVAAADNSFDALIWAKTAEDWTKNSGLFWKADRAGAGAGLLPASPMSQAMTRKAPQPSLTRVMPLACSPPTSG